MIRLKRLCSILFADPDRPYEDTAAGFLEFNAFLQATPDPDGKLAALKAECAGIAAQITAAETAVGLGQATQQTGRDLTQDQHDKALVRLRSNEAALTSDLFLADASERTRLHRLLYPQAMTPFNRAGLSGLPGLITTYLATVDQEKSALGEAFWTRSHADLDGFAGTRDQQTNQQGLTDQARKRRKGLVPIIEDALTEGYHQLSSFFRPNRALVLAYFNPRYFDDQDTGQVGKRQARVAEGRARKVFDLADADPAFVAVRLRVQDGGPLSFARAASADAPWPTDALVVTAATPLTVRIASVPGTGDWLYCRNATGHVAHYEVELLTEGASQ